ncbi:MAG: response regulator, partial [Alphaproteobacteria bacterium]|nr:response regulator [Alphaproteobacteria bacterium]
MSTFPKNKSPTPTEDPIRVMLVDDSAVIRGFLTRFVESVPDIKVIASVSNGQIALNSMKKTSFDVMVLDIEMPVMDGLTALPIILKLDPCIQVIIASTLTKENAAITLKALHAGAAECLAKPTSKELSESTIFRDNLIEKIRSLGQLTRRKRKTAMRLQKKGKTAVAGATSLTKTLLPERKFTLRSEIIKVSPNVIA